MMCECRRTVMMKCLYLLSVVFRMAAGCALSGDNNWLKITGHKGGSMLLPCSCSDLHSKPQRFTWESDRTGYLTEVFNNKQYNDRINLFNNTSPANLSLLISDLREEDQGIYKCSTEKEHRFIWLYVKGCELVKKTVVEEVTGFIGESVVLPCICTDLQDDPKTVTWELNNIKIYSEQTGHHSNRVKLVSKNPPGDLSLLISDLTEEDQGNYRCSVQADYRDFRLYVKVGRRETSTEWIKTDTITSSEQTRSKPTTSPPASFSTTQGGRRGEKVNVEGHQDCEGRQEDQVCTCTITVLPDIFLPLEILLCL
ncbi:junctional adhesion molecule-like isoform X3 [Silurus meridionalis]|uniref:junctional adhesion molecule-like isoform X3 n=1 Tax=Silurus meridionalis TaxID=175797 RepID=UPI001EEC475F|nr:junctional adhesion molecule-like isoform X3 [Silurus meridionalis]